MLAAQISDKFFLSHSDPSAAMSSVSAASHSETTVTSRGVPVYFPASADTRCAYPWDLPTSNLRSSPLTSDPHLWS